MGEPIDLDKDFFGAVTVGERGQIVIPSDARKALEIKPGEKLLFFYHRGMNCLLLTKIDYFSAMIEHFKKVADLIERRTGGKDDEDETEDT